jgi:hypothetical protein
VNAYANPRGMTLEGHVIRTYGLMIWIAGLLLCDERNEILDATVLSEEHSMHA